MCGFFYTASCHSIQILVNVGGTVGHVAVGPAHSTELSDGFGPGKLEALLSRFFTQIVHLFQIACRKNGWPLDRSQMYTCVTKFVDPDDIEERPVTVS